MNNTQQQQPLCELEDFERAVYARDYEGATLLLIQALQGFEQKTWDLVTVSDAGVARNRRKSSAKQLLTRFCSAATALICDPNWQLNRQGFEYLLLYKRYLVTLFAATDFIDMRHCLEFIGERKSDSRVQYRNEGDFFKVILACTASTGRDLVNNLLAALPVELAYLFWLSLLDNEMVLSDDADQTRNDVLAFIDRFSNVMPSDTAIHRTVNTWMFLSYMNNPDKHRVKITLNKIIKNYCQKQGAKQPFISRQRTLKKRPILLVACERFTSNHAMFRCYGRAIAGLKEHFHLVLLSAEHRVDANSLKLFDEQVILPRETKIKQIKSVISQVLAIAPDIIYYPSLGMESWAVGLAQFRLAPIQMMTMGHPATSYSEHIDYLFAEASTLGDPNCVNETVLHVEDGTFALSMGSLTAKAESVIRRNPEVVRIAVPSIAYKLNPSVLNACQSIAEQCSRPVEFHFFPNLSGVNHLAIALRLEEIMPCVVHENMHYNNYMACLSQCDLVLSPFPFGNTNGFIDSARLALPIVCLDGPEAHSHTDYAFSERVGLPEFCRANSISDYVAAAVRLVDDDPLRVTISEQLQALDIDQLLFGAASEHKRKDMNDLFLWVYQQHEVIQAQGQHFWSVDDRLAFKPVVQATPAVSVSEA
ncbi:hypothetical protein [Halioxenophilus sp. WMMB6]|uniref:hypothetical protein n=1 Tax=Halioxenophilus sp. WMMB6 TaxID=3073815 RepID=UPI00295E29EF|nr:hypothetical protein [Halioxenophilus sp. WMMB6]